MSTLSVEIGEPTSTRLSAYARRVGRTPDDVASEAVDRLLALPAAPPAERAGVKGDWRAALEGVRGMWKDRGDLDRLMADVRREANRVEPPDGPL